MRKGIGTMISAVLVLAVMFAGSGCLKPRDPGSPGAPDSDGASVSRPQWGSVWAWQMSLQMIDANEGWAVTRDGVARTTDGGAHWLTVTPKVDSAARGTGEAFGQAWFAGPDSALIARAEGENARAVTLYRTSDGGANWNRATIATVPNDAPTPRDIGFSSETNGWLLVNFGGVAMGSEMVGIYTSADGGASWQPATVTDPASQQQNALPLGGTKSGVTFANDKAGWVSGGWHGDGVWLYATLDGGRTWQRSGLPVPRGYSTDGGAVRTLAPMFFGSAGFVPATFGPERSIIFFATVDGGLTWKATMPVPSGTDSLDFAWAFTDADHGWLSDSQRIFRTDDAAAKWTEVKYDKSLAGLVQSGYRIAELNFVDDAHGWALLRSGSGSSAYALLRTTDGGLSWSDCAVPTDAGK